MNIFAQFEMAKQWIKHRLAERTSWDGGVIIGISLLVLLASPLVKWTAWAGIVYGAWTLWQSER